MESIVRTYHGTYWIGDEFGPFLLHSLLGQLLDAPIPLPAEGPGEPLPQRRAAEEPGAEQGLSRAWRARVDGARCTRCSKAP
ncbi:esterase-like activity of phytase family protein [Streptosporangium vulgare]|uniref:esterase-like activity of phytase family protein n=1 Tax=Streptosporangium vulgare TaxID=46190 RepID=UPI003CD0A97F